MIGNRQLQNRVPSGFGTEYSLQSLRVDRNREVFSFSAVDNARHQTFPAQATRRIFPTIGAICRIYYNFSHSSPSISVGPTGQATEGTGSLMAIWPVPPRLP